MKNLMNRFYKIISFSFIIFIGGTMVLSLIFGVRDARVSMAKNKKDILNYSFSLTYINNVVSAVEDACTSGVFLRKEFINLYGALQKAMGKTIIWESDQNETIMIGSDGKLYPSSGILSDSSDNSVDENAIRTYAKQASDFGAYVKSEGAELFFFLVPARYDPAYVDFPVSYNNNDKAKADSMYYNLKNNDNLTVLNAQLLYKERGLSFNELFFKTDHHWNIRTAFWAFREICNAMNEKGFDIDQQYFDSASYEVDTIKNSYLGTYGVKTGGSFAGYDDYDLIYPKFKTDYTKSISEDPYRLIKTGGKIETNGDFTQAIIISFDEMKSKKSDVYYGNYVASDRCEVIIRNNKAATDKKLLVLKDSNGLPVSAFLSTCFEEVVLLDPRYYKEGTVCEYVSEYKPDAVIMIYAPYMYYDTFFDFGLPE